MAYILFVYNLIYTNFTQKFNNISEKTHFFLLVLSQHLLYFCYKLSSMKTKTHIL